MRTVRMTPLIVIGLIAMTSATAGSAQGPDRKALKELHESDPKEAMEVVSTYLAMVEQMELSVSDPLKVLIIAHHDMKDLFRKNGTPAEAIAEFERSLEGLEDPAARAAIRFTMVDVYQTAGEPKKALDQLRIIVQEAKASLATAAKASGD